MDIEMRITELERQNRAREDRVSMQNQMRMFGAAINPIAHPGLFAQAEAMWNVYAAPSPQKAPLALSGYLNNVLKNKSVKVGSWLGEDLNAYAQRKARTLGESATDAEVAKVEREIIEYFQEKRVKEEDVLTKHPEWANKEER